MNLFVEITLFLFLFILTPFKAFSQEFSAENYPHAVISNGIIETLVFLPDTEKGFYRSSRFDWSGMIGQLKYKNHTFFMKRKSQLPHDPLNCGHGISLSEEFCIGTSSVKEPPRFSISKPGETFMKIGDGNLVKPDDGKPYQFFTNYKIADCGNWKTKTGKNRIEFTHELKDDFGFSYIYKKKIELVKGKPELIISHVLKNTGKETIIADQYCHNFFIMDFENICPDYQMQLFFPAKFNADLSNTAYIKDNRIYLTKEIKGGIFSVMEGMSNNPADGHCIITNTKTKTGVDISGDFPLSGFNFYADDNSICPEFFIGINLEPGKTKTWKRTYKFFAE
jgi:hypothetical protein